MSPTAFVHGHPLPVLRVASTHSRICMAEESEPKKPPRAKPSKTVRSNASWADTFLPEFGRKGPGSRPDWDLRPASLRTKEEGSGVCDNCKGTGTSMCHFCSGLDFFSEDGEKKLCPACKSKKTVTCHVCFGSKKQVELVGNWWEKGFAALFRE